MERERTTVATTEATIASEDDPIKRMIWSLQPDNKARYPRRLKVVLDYLGLTKLGDEDYEALRKAAIEFVKMVKGNPEGVEDRLRFHNFPRAKSSEWRDKTNYHPKLHQGC